MAKVSINLSTGSLQKDDIIVGIDLGTTNSLIAYVNDQREPIVINDTGKGRMVPSVIHFDMEGTPTVGNEAKAFLIEDSSNTIFSVKRLLGRSYKDLKEHENYFSYQIVDDNNEQLVRVKIQDKYYSPIELSGIILNELKNRAEHALKTSIKKAVITVPAYFNESQRQATKDAGKLAGLEVLRIVNEPTAASLAYGIGLDNDSDKIIAVYDLGGGTFDISILHLQNGIFEVLSTNGDTYLGGDDFDRAIVDYWIEGNGLRELSNSTYQELRLKAEQAKKSLSCQNLFNEKIGDIHLALDRSTFEQLIYPFIEKSLQCSKKALADAKINKKDIHEVVMVGGSTRTPLVKKMVSDFFERPLHDEINPDEVVSLGAAIQADILAGNRKDILLLDVTPLSLGIETIGGLMDTIIPRNSKIPTKAGRQYTTSVDGQVNMKIAVYQGERDLIKDNRKLGEFELKGIPAMPAGLPKVDINFLINADGLLKVEAIELRSNVKQEVVIKPSYGLSDEEVESMLLESFSNAKQDVETRMMIEAENEAKQIIYTAKNFIQKNSTYLIAEEIESTQKLITELEDILTNPDISKNEIVSGIDKLNTFTKPFAERVMDIAISKAMKGKVV